MKSFMDGVSRVVAQVDRWISHNGGPVIEDIATFRAALSPGDIILIRGSGPISRAIKFLTQSAWSHAAFYVGPIAGAFSDQGEPHVLVEANLGEGVVSAPLSKYSNQQTRICRPRGLTAAERRNVCRYAVARIGLDYDVKNIIDLLRLLLPLPIPRRWRGGDIPLGARDSSRIMCSALIAQAFQSVNYPVLSGLAFGDSGLHRRCGVPPDPTIFTPCDFDLSPYFEGLDPLYSRKTDKSGTACCENSTTLVLDISSSITSNESGICNTPPS